MNTDVIYLENMKRGKKTYYVNGMDVKVWYDNFYGSNAHETIKIKTTSLMSECFDFVGCVGNCWFNKKNWGFEIENERYFAFSCGTYVAIWDKIKKEYIKLCGWGTKSKFHNRQKFSEDDIKRFIKTRKKRGQRVE